jgi:hypothetical protein
MWRAYQIIYEFLSFLREETIMRIIITKKYSQVVNNMKNELGTKLLSLRTGEDSAIYQVGFGWTNGEYVTIDLLRNAASEIQDIVKILESQGESQKAKRFLQLKDQVESAMLTYRYDERDEGLDDGMWSHCH